MANNYDFYNSGNQQNRTNMYQLPYQNGIQPGIQQGYQGGVQPGYQPGYQNGYQPGHQINSFGSNQLNLPFNTNAQPNQFNSANPGNGPNHMDGFNGLNSMDVQPGLFNHGNGVNSNDYFTSQMVLTRNVTQQRQLEERSLSNDQTCQNQPFQNQPVNQCQLRDTNQQTYRITINKPCNLTDSNCDTNRINQLSSIRNNGTNSNGNQNQDLIDRNNNRNMDIVDQNQNVNTQVNPVARENRTIEQVGEEHGLIKSNKRDKIVVNGRSCNVNLDKENKKMVEGFEKEYEEEKNSKFDVEKEKKTYNNYRSTISVNYVDDKTKYEIFERVNVCPDLSLILNQGLKGSKGLNDYQSGILITEIKDYKGKNREDLDKELDLIKKFGILLKNISEYKPSNISTKIKNIPVPSNVVNKRIVDDILFKTISSDGEYIPEGLEMLEIGNDDKVLAFDIFKHSLNYDHTVISDEDSKRMYKRIKEEETYYDYMLLCFDYMGYFIVVKNCVISNFQMHRGKISLRFIGGEKQRFEEAVLINDTDDNHSYKCYADSEKKSISFDDFFKSDMKSPETKSMSNPVKAREYAVKKKMVDHGNGDIEEIDHIPMIKNSSSLLQLYKDQDLICIPKTVMFSLIEKEEKKEKENKRITIGNVENNMYKAMKYFSQIHDNGITRFIECEIYIRSNKGEVKHTSCYIRFVRGDIAIYLYDERKNFNTNRNFVRLDSTKMSNLKLYVAND